MVGLKCLTSASPLLLCLPAVNMELELTDLAVAISYHITGHYIDTMAAPGSCCVQEAPGLCGEICGSPSRHSLNQKLGAK